MLRSNEAHPVGPFLESLCERISVRLQEYQVGLSYPETLFLAQDWLVKESSLAMQTPEAVIATASVEDASLTIVTRLLTEIAEERPGTYPFSHPAIIPLSLPEIMRLIHALSILSNLMVMNNKAQKVAYLCGCIGAITRLVGEQSAKSGNAVKERGMEMPSGASARLFYLPQPGVAFCARLLEQAVKDIEHGVLRIDLQSGEVEIDDFLMALSRDAEVLRSRNREFGNTPNQQED